MARSSLIERGFELAPVALLISRNRVVCEYNERFCSLFQYRPHELVGSSLEILYPSHDDFVRLGEKWRDLMAATGEYADERLMRKADGTVFWCHVAGKAFDAAQPFRQATWYFHDTTPQSARNEALSPRERQIAALLVRGMTSKEAAQALQLSPRTVEMHRGRLMRKLRVNNVAGLMQALLA